MIPSVALYIYIYCEKRYTYKSELNWIYSSGFVVSLYSTILFFSPFQFACYTPEPPVHVRVMYSLRLVRDLKHLSWDLGKKQCFVNESYLSASGSCAVSLHCKQRAHIRNAWRVGSSAGNWSTYLFLWRCVTALRSPLAPAAHTALSTTAAFRSMKDTNFTSTGWCLLP